VQATVEEAKQEEEAAKEEDAQLQEQSIAVRVRRPPGVWQSLGSEAEIDAEQMAPSRPLVTVR
jgi:hypothetical protein